MTLFNVYSLDLQTKNIHFENLIHKIELFIKDVSYKMSIFIEIYVYSFIKNQNVKKFYIFKYVCIY